MGSRMPGYYLTDSAPGYWWKTRVLGGCLPTYWQQR